MTNIKIDPSKKTIILTNKFSQKAYNVGTKEFEELQEVHLAYPNYKIVTRTIKKKQGKESYKGLTYEYMTKYIKTHDDTGIMELAFNELLSRIECHSVKYAHIKKWFLENFPVDNLTLKKTKDFTLEDFQKWRNGNVA